jgi:traX family protein
MTNYQAILNTKKKGGGVSAFMLKLLALISMTIDHFAAIVILNGKLYGYSTEYFQMAIATEEGHRLLQIYRIFRIIGRLAFPIYAFLLTEGFRHSHDRKKYFFRLLFLGLISEVPFDLAFFNQVYNFTAQNIGFTLALGVLCMEGMHRFRKNVFYKWAAVLSCAALAELIRADYGALGIFLIAALYNFRKEKALRLSSGAALSAALSYGSYCFAALSFLPIAFYNGEKGRLSLSRLFYIYYPLHLGFFYLLVYLGAKITA